MKNNELIKFTVAGFSLANLMVVLAVLAILAAILMPISFNLVEKARMAADLANARLLYQATEAFATFNRSTPGTVDPTDLSPYIGDVWPPVLSTVFAGNFVCEIEPDGEITITTGSAIYDPSSGALLRAGN